MTPLAASLVFIIVSIIISTIKHFIFPSNSPTTTEQSSIQLKKIYTITDKSTQKRNKSYGSFYQAYHQFHIEEIEQRKQKIEQNFMLGYNSVVMKKSIINDESVVICDENYLAVISQGIVCNTQQKLFSMSETHCTWQTTFNIYQLPLLKQHTKQTIILKGRLINENNKHSKFNQKINQLSCKKQSQSKYSITFPLLTQSKIWKMDQWRVNRVVIEKGDQEGVRQFDVKQQYMKLEDIGHYPIVYSATSDKLCYTTESQPWLIRCLNNNTGDWQHINIMQKSTQNKVYQGFATSTSRRSPPFQRIERVDIKHMFLFSSTQIIYSQNCQINPQCEQTQISKTRNFVTVVYEHVNNPYRVEKFYIQLTFQLNSDQVDINISNFKQQFQTYQKGKLISHSLLISQLNPSRIIHSDCAINHKRKQIKQRYYDKYYWLYEQKVIAEMDIHSLLCVFRFDIDQHLRIASTDDIICSEQVNNYYDLNFLDWRNVKKIINYKENFDIYLQKRNQSTVIKQSDATNQTQHINSQEKTLQQHQLQQLQSQQRDNQVDIYLEIIKEEMRQEDENTLTKQNKEQQENQKQQTLKSKNNKKTKKNKKSTKSKSNKNKPNKKKQKSPINNTNNINQNYPSTPLQGQHKPSIQTSYNYSFYRQTYTYPIRSEVRKYKFPLPFLLSFTQKMQIINPQPSKPLILFSGVKQYLFTYQLKQLKAKEVNNTSLNKVVDYRYLTLGQTLTHNPKIISQNEGTPQHQIQTSKTIIDQLANTIDINSNQQINLEITDETHPEIENAIKTIQEADEKILNQIKSIKSVPVCEKKTKLVENSRNQAVQSYQRYLIVVWGWGIEVYMVDWDKNGLFGQNITQQEIEIKLSQKSNSLMEYFLPFIELFATFYCMFQALISSR